MERDLPHCRDDQGERDEREDDGDEGDDADARGAAAIGLVATDFFVIGGCGGDSRMAYGFGRFDQADSTDIKFASQGMLLRVARSI